MSQFVKTKRQANFKGFKRFGSFKGLIEQKNVIFNSFVCKLGLFWHSTRAKKGPIYTQTRQINYYYSQSVNNIQLFELRKGWKVSDYPRTIQPVSNGEKRSQSL
jgi:hypothetical protein